MWWIEKTYFKGRGEDLDEKYGLGRSLWSPQSSVDGKDIYYNMREVKKGDVVKAVVVWQKKPFRRKDGSYIRFDENAVVIVNNKMEPVGNRLLGVLPREIKENAKFSKIAALAPEFV